MEQRISLSEANQHLARYIKAVEAGEEIIITRRGQPIARLMPLPREQVLCEERQAARERTRMRMQQGYALGGEPVSRDELHER
ncbi:MAG: type II toxin-antitoxin system prevent-host-death family antitoxin [Magnetococcales bacterium]|nr:type II toxin-antitoxin system prevent-host-death family antitoxin [Magnetococcales bacterium]MBF0149426.1 type II toxin-antitoxin system prevent-host-death family antitoxin [Magnetococcales bacterium]MBF0171922.1 type II toxin-antitoxin system prevent-host-death family antitoxin [Magnetococcales bacterium]MBF0630497.1 type II toxin-antitoxin system prevent-host-death family antitoxin [Magnetococcales bacterium]